MSMINIVPLFKVRDMKQAIQFYTKVLDFKFKYEEDSDDNSVVDLILGNVELQLTTHESQSLFGSVANIFVDEVDELFLKYKKRGLDPSKREKSPVHLGPVNQTWGMREFYVTDADDNTLRFCKQII